MSHEHDKNTAISGFELSGLTTRHLGPTTTYTDAANRATFSAAEVNNDGTSRYPCYVEIEVIGVDTTTASVYAIINSSRCTADVQATCIAAGVGGVGTITWTAVAIGALGNAAHIIQAISSTGTTTIVTTVTASTVTVTFDNGEVDASEVIASVAAKATAAALMVGTLPGTDGPADAKGDTALSGGVSKDSQAARLTAIGTAATGAAGYRVQIPVGKLFVWQDGGADGIRDVIVKPGVTGYSVDIRAAYRAEN